MIGRPFQFLAFVAIVSACVGRSTLGDPPAAQPATPARTTHFKLRLLGDVDANATAGTPRIVSDTVLAYAWTVRGGERTLSFDSTHLEATEGDKRTMDVTMDAHRIVDVKDGKTSEVDADHGPQRVRDLLQAMYGPPIAKLTVDGNGREVAGSRTVVATGMAGAMAPALITNAVLMHAPYFADRKEWQAPAVVMISGSDTAEGTLTYTRVADRKGLPTFAVAGTVARDQFGKAGAPFFQKNAKEVISGTQSYDPAAGEWVSGAWTMDVSFDVFSRAANKVVVAAAKSTIKLTFERVEAGR